MPPFWHDPGHKLSGDGSAWLAVLASGVIDVIEFLRIDAMEIKGSVAGR